MKECRWNLGKNEWLKRTRGIGFEQLIFARQIVVEKHPRRERQTLLIFEYEGYAWSVPCLDGGDHYFLKTAYPSKKYTRIHLKGGKSEEKKDKY